MWHFTDFFEDELTDPHALHQFNGQGTDIPDFKPQLSSVSIRVVRIIAKARVNCGGRDVDTETKSGQAALPLDSGTQA